MTNKLGAFAPLLVLPVALSIAAAGMDNGTLGEPRLPSPVTDAQYYDEGRPPAAKVELGRLLFFDRILSGNQNISCATCHHPSLATADRVALGLGEGAEGLGPERSAGLGANDGVHERVPRNSPALFNLGAREFTRVFHDGRVEVDTLGNYASGFISPAKWKLPEGLDNVLSAQAMFPVTSPTEMAGQKGENSIADARSLNNAAGPGGVWEQLGQRLADLPEYVELFRSAYPEQVTEAGDVNYVLAANAIAAFETEAFRSDQSPFDRFLRGEDAALGPDARRGMELFYGKAGCSDCHSGPFQTDHDFHAIAMPQIGPGKGDGSDAAYWSKTGEKAFTEDFGRGRVTVRPQDAFKFRTPSLRNVALTGPWGHAGAYESLEAVVRHHADPVGSLERYSLPTDLLPRLDAVLETSVAGARLEVSPLSARRLAAYLQRDDWVQRHEPARHRIAAANELEPRDLSAGEVDAIVAFLHSLTDPSAARLEELIPDRVPSGLPVER